MDTKAEIEYYLKQAKPNGALMIKGAWGCGKTYFLKGIRDEYNKGNDYAIVLVSLFDIISPEALDKKIKQEIANVKALNVKDKYKRKIKNTQLKEKASAVLSAVEDSCDLAKSANALLAINYYDFIFIENKIKCFDKEDKKIRNKQLVLIFDDFERCGLGHKQLLGIVNEFVENRGIKTIIVADESKIEDDGYYEFKEKAISRTITFNADHSRIIKLIVDLYPETGNGYSAFLKDNVSLIIDAFNDSLYDNIRTIINAINDFERFYDVWMAFGRGTNDLSWTLYQFIALSSEYKAGNFVFSDHYMMYMIMVDISQFNEKDEKKHQQLQMRENNRLKSKYKDNTFQNYLTSIAKWIVESEWNETNFKNALDQQYPLSQEMPEITWLNKKVLDMSEYEVKTELATYLRKSYLGELSIEEYVKLLNRIKYLRDTIAKIDTTLLDGLDYSQMEGGLDSVINKIHQEHTESQYVFDVEYDAIEAEAKSIADKINALHQKSAYWYGYNGLKNTLENYDPMNDWNKYLTAYIIDIFDEAALNLFISRFDRTSNYGKKTLADFISNTQINGNSLDENRQSLSNLQSIVSHLDEAISSEKDSISLYALTYSKEKITDSINIMSNRIKNIKN